MRIRNTTFLVTGGASGLGAGTARRLAAAGANILIADLNQAAIDASTSHFGALHGLINCAGILGAARIVGREGPHDLALFQRVIQVNLIGTFNMLRLAAAAMSKNEPNAEGERGIIINTASVAAFEGQIGQAAYSASKGGVAAITLPAARELARFGIRVVAIAPGIFETAMMQAAPEVVQQSLAAQTLFPPRLGRADEYAQLALQIIENPMLNGTVIRLDGAVRLPAK